MNHRDMNDDFTKYGQQIDQSEAVRKTMMGVYGWMTLALVITAISGVFIATDRSLLLSVLRFYWFFAIAEVVLVIFLSARVFKMKSSTAKICFLLYSVLNGITLSSIFSVYALGTIGHAFFVTAGVFAVMTIYGYVTKTDLTKIGNLFVMALFGMIIATIANMLIGSEGLSMLLTYIGVFVFIGLVGYDTQKIKEVVNYQVNSGGTIQNAAIIGALSLYLDFINIFIRILSIVARRD